MSLGCDFSPITLAKMTAVNGSMLTYEAQYYNFDWKMQGWTYIIDVLLIELDSYDMVLGVKWLRQLGDITWNFNNLWKKFLYQVEECTLKGIPKQRLQMINSEDMQKILSSKNQVATMQLCRLEGPSYFNVPIDSA